MLKKHLYEAPDAELLVIDYEENLLASEFKPGQLEEGNSDWWDDED